MTMFNSKLLSLPDGNGFSLPPAADPQKNVAERTQIRAMGEFTHEKYIDQCVYIYIYIHIVI